MDLHNQFIARLSPLYFCLSPRVLFRTVTVTICNIVNTGTQTRNDVHADILNYFPTEKYYHETFVQFSYLTKLRNTFIHLYCIDCFSVEVCHDESLKTHVFREYITQTPWKQKIRDRTSCLVDLKMVHSITESRGKLNVLNTPV